ncbi:LPXTG cell wall anchor domain-containing protein [Pseudactinotalea sp. HY160]|nr:LPXTG cell wall anchor domain-containing protein [Pseudactinotalea sp. HY160]
MSVHRRRGLRTMVAAAAVVPLTLGLSVAAGAETAVPPAEQPQLESRVKEIITVDDLEFRDLNGNGVLDPYEDWRLSADDRTGDLVERMSLTEKSGLMLIDTLNAACEDGVRGAVPAEGTDYIENQAMHLFVFRNTVAGPEDAVCGEPGGGFRASTVVTPAEAAQFTNSVQEMSEATRLGIPSLFKSNARNHIDPNARAGINESAGAFTSFPKEAGIAAAALGAEAAATGEDPTTGDMSVVEDFASIMGDEWASIGLRGMYGYMADLSTEPRWYRAHETFTEDADLNANIMTSLVSSLQGEVGEDGLALTPESQVALTLKHFPGGGPQQLGLDPHYAFGKGQVYPADMFGEHLKPFEAAIEAGVSSIMPYYGVPVDVTYNGEELPETGMAFSDAIVNGLLRDQLGFPGYVNSDTGIITDRAWGLEDATVPERVAAAINSGTDTLSGFHDVQVILDLVADGLVDEARVDLAAERILAQFFRMGLFENPYVDPAGATETVGAAAHREVGLQTQRDSLVLLENSQTPGGPVLPLADDASVYVLGGIDGAAVADRGYDVTSGDTPDGAGRPSAAGNDYAVISLTANASGGDYVSNDPASGLDPEHGVNPAVIDGIPGYDGQSPWGAADVCSTIEGAACTDNGLRFGGAYPWESSVLDFTGMEAADSWEVTPSLATIQEVIAEIGDPSKVILDVYFRQPYVLDEASGLRDVGAIVADFGTSTGALLDVLSGKHDFQGRMPFALAGTAEAILEQDSDRPGYDETTDGALYPFGYGLSYEGEAAPSTLTAQPEVTGPIPVTEDSVMWSSMANARVPFDVADHGFVEEEYFLSGTSSIYSGESGAATAIDAADYTNNILVRRPADAADFSGVVLVDILNASNGFPGEDHWRRMWQWALEEGHAVIGLTSKPIQIDALHNYDPQRYADLSWDVEDTGRDPIVADPDDPGSFDPFMVVPGAQEGLVWDITTQLGVLLDRDPGSILGGMSPETTLLLGQSQSAIYLRTYVESFHAAQSDANGGSLWDGYLNTAGAHGVRPLQQGDTGYTRLPGELPALDVPMISVTAEGDGPLFGLNGVAEREYPANNFQWQVPGTPHTDLLSPVIPADEEIYQAGRLPNTDVHEEAFRASLNIYPLEPTIIAAAEALIDADQQGTVPAASLWYDQAGGDLVRDESGNVTGGVRSGLLEYPLGQYLGAASPGAVYGSMALISAEEFADTYGTRADYLDLMGTFDAGQIEAGYLSDWGADYLVDVANELLDRIGVADLDPTDPTAAPTETTGPTGSLPDTGADMGPVTGLVVLALLLGGAAVLVARRRPAGAGS